MKVRYKAAVLILTLIFLVFLPHNSLVNNIETALKKQTVLSKDPLENKAKEIEAKAIAERKAKQKTLVENIAQVLSVNNQFALSIIDIDHNEEFGISENIAFHSASVTKILVATAALQGVESGKYKLSQPLGNGTFKYQLMQMINQSNNNSWDLFNNLLGFSGEQKVADQLGLVGVNISQTHMTTSAVSKLLLKLYKGEALQIENRDLLFSYMQNTETENRISPAIPNGISFYHKTGSFGGGIHDAAIVIHPKNPFILVIFTNDNKGTPWDTRFNSIQKAAGLIYSYFESI